MYIDLVGEGTVTVAPQPLYPERTEFSDSTTVWYADADGGGIDVELEASAAAGYQFGHWELVDPDDEVTSTAEALTTLQLRPDPEWPAQSDWTIRAVFEEVPQLHTLTMGVDGQGSTVPGVGTHEFDVGEVVTIMATPADGWEFTHWTGPVSDTGSPETTVTMDEDKTATANFAARVYTIDVTVVPEDAGSVVGEGQYEHGETATLLATPAQGYSFVEWTENGAFVSAAAEYSFVATNDRALTASFSAQVHTITATAAEGGSIDPVGEVPLAAGGSQTFAITPAEGHAIADVVVDGQSIGAVEQHTFHNVSEDHTIHAEFVRTYTLTYLAGPGGTVNGQTEVVQTVKDGDDGDPVTAAPADGYRFVDWDDGVETKTRKDTNVTQDITVTATFAPDTRELEVTSTEGGHVIVPGEGTFSYEHGTGVPLHAQADEDHSFAGWIGDTGTVDDPAAAETSIEMLDDYAITAQFDPLPYHTITASADEGGSIEPAGEVDVLKGTEKSFTITPAKGYVIDDVLVDGHSVYEELDFTNGVATHTLTDITGEHSVQATFALKQYTITATAGENGTIAPAGKVKVDHGSEASFTITPDEGHMIDAVLIDGVSVGAVGEYTFAEVTDDHSIHALFRSPQASRQLESGWHLLSVPVLPADPEPAAAFQSVTVAGYVLTIFEWAPGNSYHEPSVVDPGGGYWLFLEGELRVEVTGVLPSGDYEVQLEDAGWHLVSTPRWPVPWQGVTFTDGESTLPLEAAIAAEWIEPYAFLYCSEDTQYVAIVLPGTTARIDPWTGYWLKTIRPGLTAILPLDEPWFPSTPAVHLKLAEVPARLTPPPAPNVSELSAGFLTAVGYPNPVTGAQATFRVTGLPAESVRATVLDLGGRAVWQSQGAGNQLSWDLTDSAGRTVANGVYLYMLEAKVGGRWMPAGTDRLLITR